MADNEDERQAQIVKARRGRSIALALVLGGLVILFFVMTIVHMGGRVGIMFQ